MLCSEFDARFHRLLDLRQAPEQDPTLLGHAKGCSHCHAQMATMSRLLDSLDVLETPPLPDDFSQRVVDSLQVSKPRATLHKSHAAWGTVAVALAATLLLTAVPIVWYAAKGGLTVAQPSIRTPRTTPPVIDAPALADSGEGWMKPRSILELYSEETRQRHRQQVNQIADDLRPIATPFNAAMTAIRRSIPVRKNETKGGPRASIARPLTVHNIS